MDQPAFWTPPAAGTKQGSKEDLKVDATAPSTGSATTPTATVPVIGAHAIAFHRWHSNAAPLVLPKMKTAPTGSTIVVSVGRGEKSHFATRGTTDNKNPGMSYSLIGRMHEYTKWPTSATAVFALTAAKGGDDHVVTTSTPADDEITAAAVEVKGGSVIADIQWNEPLVGSPTTTRTVTTTGPAVLISFWWGDGDAASKHVAVPNNGFTVLDFVGEPGSLVQCFVAAKAVAAAGTYDMTWTSTPAEGAQLWLVAVQ